VRLVKAPIVKKVHLPRDIMHRSLALPWRAMHLALPPENWIVSRYVAPAGRDGKHVMASRFTEAKKAFIVKLGK
jgi:hypothetical protein